LFWSHYHVATPAINQRIKARSAAGREIRMSSARACAEDANLSIDVWQGTHIFHGARQISDHLIIRHTAIGADLGGNIFRRSMSCAEI